jgi:hypothetical protein
MGTHRTYSCSLRSELSVALGITGVLPTGVTPRRIATARKKVVTGKPSAKATRKDAESISKDARARPTDATAKPTDARVGT